MDLDTPLSTLPGIGPGICYKLKKLGLLTVWDLINHFPFRYDDFSNISSAFEAKEGESVTLVGEIWSIKNIYTRSKKVLTRAVFNDSSTPIELVWFNQGWLTKQIQVGDRLQVSGKIKKYKNSYSIMAPVWERVGAQSTDNSPQMLHTGKLVPVYPETEGLSSKWLRTRVDQLLGAIKVEDPLPGEVREGMLDLNRAIHKIHQPKDYQDVEAARERLGFDELFFIQLATLKSRQDWGNKPVVEALQISKIKFQISNFIKKLPFKLTGAQQRVIKEILADLQKEYPMNRLVQGEVGSGKTVVAAVIAYVTHLSGYRTFYMAPTEILAFQHYSTLSNLLEPFGIKVGIYTGSRKYTKIEKNHQSTPDVVVGTHALLTDKLSTEDVGLVIIDEQQRFGVDQRSLLRSKARLPDGQAKIPHFLTMTATPIPRTVALTLYGDLDLSVIDELPRGRKVVKTFVVPNKKRGDAYKFIEKKISNGDQAYIVTPLIEESETLQVKAAKVEFERLQKEVFPDLKLGLLHGRLKSKEKNQVLSDFKDKKIDILVSTTVVEVGVDVTNATIMVIEGAERYGLSQLHQLRGRVGRGEKESFCFLFLSSEDPQSKNRLKNLEKISDGMKLAELDLKIRGGGEIFGTRQSGRFELKIASFSDLELIEKTRAAAAKILEDNPTLDKYPNLAVKLSSGVMPD